MFVTNNGMELEHQRAARLSKLTGFDIPEDRMFLAHSSLRDEAEAVGEGLTLVTGRGSNFCLQAPMCLITLGLSL